MNELSIPGTIESTVDELRFVPTCLRTLKAIGEIALEQVYLNASAEQRTKFDHFMGVISASGLHCIASVDVIEFIQTQVADNDVMMPTYALQETLRFYMGSMAPLRPIAPNFIELAKNQILNFSTEMNGSLGMIDDNVALSMSLRAKDVSTLLDANPFIISIYLVCISGAWTSFYINTRGTPGNPLSIQDTEQGK